MALAPFANEFRSANPPQDVLANVLLMTTDDFAAMGYRVTAQSPQSVTMERRYLPGWGVVVGILTFPIGILIWAVYRRSATLTFSFVPDGQGTRVVITGEGEPNLREYASGLGQGTSTANSERTGADAG